MCRLKGRSGKLAGSLLLTWRSLAEAAQTAAETLPFLRHLAPALVESKCVPCFPSSGNKKTSCPSRRVTSWLFWARKMPPGGKGRLRAESDSSQPTTWNPSTGQLTNDVPLTKLERKREREGKRIEPALEPTTPLPTPSNTHTSLVPLFHLLRSRRYARSESLLFAILCQKGNCSSCSPFLLLLFFFFFMCQCCRNSFWLWMPIALVRTPVSLFLLWGSGVPTLFPPCCFCSCCLEVFLSKFVAWKHLWRVTADSWFCCLKKLHSCGGCAIVRISCSCSRPTFCLLCTSDFLQLMHAKTV